MSLSSSFLSNFPAFTTSEFGLGLTLSCTTDWPLTRAMDRTSSSPSSMRPRSRKRTGFPDGVGIMMFSSSSTLLNSPTSRSQVSSLSWVMYPDGFVT